LLADIKILKFGGTSVEDWPAFERAAQIVRASAGSGLVVVVSAIGGFTDALIRSFQSAATGETSTASQALEKHFERHLIIAGSLSPGALAAMEALIEKTRREINELLGIAATSDTARLRIQDEIVSFGEFLSANLLTLVLEQHGIPASYVDARRCIVTNEAHGNASPLLEEVSSRTRTELKPLLESRRVSVLGGFIGATVDGIPTTLGRGSSDYSATLIGAALDAGEIQIWTDVDGLQTADPGLVKSARTVPSISYEEASQLARLGARLMHPKMIEPIIGPRIPIRIRNSRAAAQPGTLISVKSESGEIISEVIKAIAYRPNLTTIDIRATPAFVANGFGHAIGEIFAQHETELHIVARSKEGITCAYEEDGRLPSIVQDLERLGSVEVSGKRAIIGCVGDDLGNGSSGAAAMLGALRNIDPSLTWHGSGSNNLIAIVAGDQVGSIVQRLHQGIFE
jgi:aspartate kinase